MKGKKVLIIDDERPLVETVSARLKAIGFIVEAVHEGSAALGKIREFLPEVILLDIGLPGKDGRDIISEMKKDQDLEKIPVVIISGKDAESDIEYGRNLGAIEYIIKPFSLHLLTNKIKRLLGEG